MTKAEAKRITGGLGQPSKMPGHAYGLSALECRTGSRLARAGIPGPCRDCYALQGHYIYPSVAKAHANRLKALGHKDWARVMAWSILQTGDPEFRWQDSGDLQSEAHMDKIAQVCRATPGVRHWLPTQEWGIVRAWIRQGNSVPTNLVIRFSSRRYGDAPRFKVWGTWSSVTPDSVPDGAYECPSSQQGNKCGECRACWDPSVAWVVYHKH